jgi:hypothetical protein
MPQLVAEARSVWSSLLAKLDNAQRKVNGGQIAVACNGLDAYVVLDGGGMAYSLI